MEQGTIRVPLRAENQFQGSKSYFSVILCLDNHPCHTQTYRPHTHTYTHTDTHTNKQTNKQNIKNISKYFPSAYIMTPHTSQNQS